MIGPNSAGKTTLINVMCGMPPLSAGKVWLGEQDISDKPFHIISQLGVMRSFQQTNTFRKATVDENLFRALHFNNARGGPQIDLSPLIEEFDLSRHMLAARPDGDKAPGHETGRNRMIADQTARAPV